MGDDKRLFRGTSFVSSFRKSLRQSYLMTRHLSVPPIAFLAPVTGQLRKKDVGYSHFGQEQDEADPMYSVDKEEKTVLIGQEQEEADPMHFVDKGGKTVPIGQAEEEALLSDDIKGNLTSPSGDRSLQVHAGVEDSTNKDELKETEVCGKSQKNKTVLNSLFQRVQSSVQTAAAYARRKISDRKH